MEWFTNMRKAIYYLQEKGLYYDFLNSKNVKFTDEQKDLLNVEDTLQEYEVEFKATVNVYAGSREEAQRIAYVKVYSEKDYLHCMNVWRYEN